MSQLSFEFTLAPLVPIQSCTPIADKLIEAGFAPNDFILNLNRGPTNDDELPAPSRLYGFPVEYFEPSREEIEGIYLRHPGIAHLPFVKRLEECLGMEIKPRAKDEFGRPFGEITRWWHAVDLMTDAHHQHLLETQHLTTRGDMLGALTFNLEINGISVKNAKAVLAALEIPEPKDRSKAVLLGKKGIDKALYPAKMDINHDNGKPLKQPYWTINFMQRHRAVTPWLIIHGIEDGYFERRRCGHLKLTEKAIKDMKVEK